MGCKVLLLPMKMPFNIGSSLVRKKTTSKEEESKLARVLTLTDLSLLGIGGTLGLGIYVLAGAVARNQAGPAVCLSFLVAAVASAFAGICYAEFASRVPRAGSAYVYSYVTVGEFVAYIIGWNLILEYVIGTASVARGLSSYADSLANNVMKNTLTEYFPIHIDFLSSYPDFLSLLLITALTVLLSIGVKESTSLNNIFTIINLTTVAIVLVAGAFKADVKNWAIEKEDIPPEVPNAGNGGFLPFGIAGVMAGAAKCFYGFVGFDAVATTGEEAKNPQRNIPIAIVISLIVIFLAYFGISTVLTLMWPYYDQNPDAPFPYVFEKVGWPVVKWIVTIGAVFALCTSLLGAMFPLPRIIYAMSSDGLLFKWLSTVHPRTKTPILATIVSGVLASIMAVFFDLQQLIDMMSIGTLLAYTIVAICVLILRYEPEFDFHVENSSESQQRTMEATIRYIIVQYFNLHRKKQADGTSALITKWATAAFCVMAVLICAISIYGLDYLTPEEPLLLGVLAAVAVVTLMIVIIIGRQPESNIKLAFKVPFVPIIPCLSILINLYLMLELDLHTWIRFVAWLIVGFIIYFFYGILHSEERHKKIMSAKRHDSQTTASVHSDTKDDDETKKEVSPL